LLKKPFFRGWLEAKYDSDFPENLAKIIDERCRLESVLLVLKDSIF
jgi:hypothetical protein